MIPKTLKTINGEIDILEPTKIMDPDDPKVNLYGLQNLGKEFNVVVRKGLQHNLKQQTLMHEIIHTIENMHSMELSEMQVEILATGLLYIIKNNHELIEYFKKEKK